jgi:hypothetical protein
METISKYHIFKAFFANISSSIQISSFRDMLGDVLQADSFSERCKRSYQHP